MKKYTSVFDLPDFCYILMGTCDLFMYIEYDFRLYVISFVLFAVGLVDSSDWRVD